MPSCQHCNVILNEHDRFCGVCGARRAETQMAALEAATPEVAAPEIAAPEFAATEVAVPEVAVPDVAASGVAVPDVASTESSVQVVAPVAATPFVATPAADDSPASLLASNDAASAAAPSPSASAASVSAASARAEDGFAASPIHSTDAPPAPGAGRTAVVRQHATGGRLASNKLLEEDTVLNNRYEIVRKIGGGGMGAVYYAKDRNLGDAPRAVKEMIQSQLDETQQEKAISDFKRESMLLAALEHHSIPTIYDYFYDAAANRFYLVMKYISGGDFLARLRSAPTGRLDERTVTEWGIQIADVLDYLHNRPAPIIYRDLKPANLMIDGATGRVMLIDFGIARWVAPQEKGVTAVGTMGYAPPELFSGKVETRSDIYSLGATMFHLLTGADPQENPLLIFDFAKNPRPRALNPQLSVEMERILMRAVEYKTEDRFTSAGELREALVHHLERLRAGALTFAASGATPTLATARASETIAVEMVYCGFCGGRITAEDVFCAHCGKRQPLTASSAALRQARATARLVVAGTTELDASFLLHKEDNLVGRSDPHSNIFPEIDLTRFDPHTKVSRKHARIWRTGGVFLIEDLGSVNGTVVNDTVALAPRQPRGLENGDRLRLGETVLHFLVG